MRLPPRMQPWRRFGSSRCRTTAASRRARPSSCARFTPRSPSSAPAARITSGTPRAEVLDRYRDAGAEIFRTDRDGAVTIDTDGYSIDVHTFTGRQLHLDLSASKPRRHEEHEDMSSHMLRYIDHCRTTSRSLCTRYNRLLFDRPSRARPWPARERLSRARSHRACSGRTCHSKPKSQFRALSRPAALPPAARSCCRQAVVRRDQVGGAAAPDPPSAGHELSASHRRFELACSSTSTCRC